MRRSGRSSFRLCPRSGRGRYDASRQGRSSDASARSADQEEFRATAAILRRDQSLTDAWRFASIELREPAKADVKAWRPGIRCPGARSPCCGTGAPTRPTRRVVDLTGDGVVSWTHVPGACPNFTVDEYHEVDHALHEHEGVIAALAGRGITDLSPGPVRRLDLRQGGDAGAVARPPAGLVRHLAARRTRRQPVRPPGLRAQDHRRHEHPRGARDRGPPRLRVARGRRPSTTRRSPDRRADRPQAAGDHPARGRLLHPRRQRAALAELVDAARLQLSARDRSSTSGSTTLRRDHGTRAATSPTGCRSPRWSCPTATPASTTTGARRSTSASGVWAT